MSKSTSPGSLMRLGSEQGLALGSFLGRPESQLGYCNKVALKLYYLILALSKHFYWWVKEYVKNVHLCMSFNICF